jgi:hypothetical protein
MTSPIRNAVQGKSEQTTLCDICKRPLSASEINLKVTAHFPCIFNECFGETK